MSCDVNQLIEDSKCFDCIPPGMQEDIQTYLFTQIGAGATPTPTPTNPCDYDAVNFIMKSGITDPIQTAAICQLVTDLKTYPAVGTKYWNRDVLIYPLVGGNATSHAVNLKTPGTYNLSFANGPIHSANGIQGVIATTAYANTNYQIPAGSQNSLRCMAYVHAKTTNGANRFLFGVSDVGATWRTVIVETFGSAQNFSSQINDALGVHVSDNGNTLGAWFIQRQNATQRQNAFGVLPWNTAAYASAAPAALNLVLLALNNGGAIALPTDAILSGFSLGSPLTTDAERLEYKGIWDTYETALSRGHP